MLFNVLCDVVENIICQMCFCVCMCEFMFMYVYGTFVDLICFKDVSS